MRVRLNNSTAYGRWRETEASVLTVRNKRRFGLRAYGRLAVWCALVSFAICAVAQSPQVQSSIRFRDIAQEAGVNVGPSSDLEKKYLVEMMGGGVALFDCDNDGMLDILAVNQSSTDRFLRGGDPMVTLYHQDSRLHFADITAQAGLTTRGWGMGIAVGDFDNDGYPDIYVTGYGHNVLYRNLGGCKFEDVTERAHVSGGGFSVGAAWADYDRDGRLDLFVSRYVDDDIHHLPQPGSYRFGYRGVPIETPHSRTGQTNLLYHNCGDGTFEEVSSKAGVADPAKELGMGVVWADYDNDGWPDLLVTNDMGPNFLYRNRHNGSFEELGLSALVALGEDGDVLGNMAADFGDINHDGALDLIMTRYAHQPLSIYRNDLAHGVFVDDTKALGLHHIDNNMTRWGVGFADFDNDGWNDFLVANGNFSPLIDSLPSDPRFVEPLLLFRNNTGTKFLNVSDSSGLNSGPLQSRRGAAFGDIDNDGNIDAVVYNVDAPPSLFLNVTENSNHRVLFRLLGKTSNKAAIGARVIVTTSSASGIVQQIDEVRGGGSYLSSNDQRLHFGLGAAATIQHVQVRWPSGFVEDLGNLPANAIYTIVEGQGIKGSVKLAAAVSR